MIFFLLLPFTFANHAYSQNDEQRSNLLKLAEKFSNESAAKKAEAIRWAEANNLPVRQELEDGTIIELMYLNEHGMPMYNTTFNAEGATVIKSDKVYPGGGAGLNLTGTGQTLGMWDGGGTRTTHQEFHDGVSSRVTQKDVPGGLSNHATHVAGTMIAAGTEAAARGMSYAANLDAYDWNSDDAEMALAAANDNIRVSQHSYGFLTGWAWGNWSGNSAWHWFGNTSNPAETEAIGFGLYSNDTKGWDEIAHNAPHYLIVKSAGNDRDDDPGAQPVGHYVYNGSGFDFDNTTVREKDGGVDGYKSIPYRGNAKNIMTVGAVTAAGAMAGFSGWGPTDDGRIKPDIVTKGVAVYSSLASADNTYDSWGGTSMSGPMVSGSVGLLLQHQENLHPGDALLSSTMKGLILHTADDLGNTGPDYSNGWGMMNTEAAAVVMSANATTPIHIFERTINDGDAFNLLVKATGSEPLQATIVWTDVPGVPVNPPVLNAPDAMLVNDLDLRLTQMGGATFEPYILDPANPGNNATTGDNFRDNVEVVYIASPVEDGLYSLTITHKGSLSGGSQQFSLIVTGNKAVNEVYIAQSQDNASNYGGTWNNGDNEGYGFGAWSLSNGTNGGFSGWFIGNPEGAGITGMGTTAFGLYANPFGAGNFVNADRAFVGPLAIGSTFSLDWGVNWDSDGAGNKGINIYTGGTGGTQIININMGGSSAITINGNPMFNNYGTNPMTINFEYVSAENLRVFATGRDGVETYDQTLAVTGAPDAVRFYASDLAAGDQRQSYFNNLQITPDFTAVPAAATARIIGQVDQDEHLTVEDLLIESGNQLHVKPGKNLSVTGDLINTAGSSKLVLESDATGTASLLHQNNDVDLSIQRYLTGDADILNMHYHTVSVPLTQGSNPVTGLFTGAYLYRFDQPTQNYVTMGTSTTTPLNVNEGYLTYYPGASTTLTFEGKANNGAFAAAVSYPAAGNNYNLVPNPYPSAIDWDAAGWTKTNTNAAIYIYNTASSGTGNVVWASYVAGSGGVGVNDGTNIIPAGQAFFVQSNAADPVLSMTNDVRVHSAQNFYKEQEEVVETLRLFAQADDFEDEIVVRFVPESSHQFDGQFDALKFKNWSAAPNIYSFTADKTELNINSIPYATETFVVDLGFEWEGAGDAAINFEGIDSFGDWVTIFFEDRLTGARIDLQEASSYAFTHMPDYPTERFLLRFMGVTGNEELDAVTNEIFAWSKDGLLHVYIPETMGKTQIDIFDLQGRVLYQQESLPGNLYRIDELPQHAALLVRLTGSTDLKTQKVINR